MTTREQFFYDHAGHCHDPLHETEEQGHVRGAIQLAKAEIRAAHEGWTYEWQPDADGCQCDSEEEHRIEVCILYGNDGIPLTSLSGICGATPSYSRVVKAELALQVMGWPVPAPQEPQEAAVKAAPRYTVNLHTISLHGGERVREVYQGGDETVMYSHVSAIEWTLAMTGGTAEIEIVEDGRERWIDYQDGKRDGLPQEAE